MRKKVYGLITLIILTLCLVACKKETEEVETDKPISDADEFLAERYDDEAYESVKDDDNDNNNDNNDNNDDNDIENDDELPSELESELMDILDDYTEDTVGIQTFGEISYKADGFNLFKVPEGATSDFVEDIMRTYLNDSWTEGVILIYIEADSKSNDECEYIKSNICADDDMEVIKNNKTLVNSNGYEFSAFKLVEHDFDVTSEMDFYLYYTGNGYVGFAYTTMDGNMSDEILDVFNSIKVK